MASLENTVVSTPDEAQRLADTESVPHATSLGDEVLGRDGLNIEHLEDRVLMSSDAAVAMAAPESASPAPAAYVGSQTAGEKTSGGPPTEAGGSAEASAPAEVIDAAAEATAAVARGEGESRGAKGGTPGNPQAPSRNEPKEPVEIAEARLEPLGKGETLVEGGEKHEPEDSAADGERAKSPDADGHAAAKTSLTQNNAAEVDEMVIPALATQASEEAEAAPPKSASNPHSDLPTGAVETKLEVVAQVDLASLRPATSVAGPSTEQAPAAPAAAEPEHRLSAANEAGSGAAMAAEAGSPLADSATASHAPQNSPDLAARESENVETPQAHDAVFDAMASQGLADAVQASPGETQPTVEPAAVMPSA
jgi:hypothetical protein